jgi:hypothetical protein
MKRKCIYTSDIVAFTGRSDAYARKVLRQAREHYQKPKGAIITLEEFAKFTKINLQELEMFIK